MPWVKAHTRNGRRVRAHYRVGSQVAWVIGLILIVILAALRRKHGG